jgi:hypothetical protein
MSQIMNLNTEKARLQPDTVFSRPLDIVPETGLTRGQKIAALERWDLTVQDRMRAADEGMEPPAGQTAREAATIVEIGQALDLLQKPSSENGDPVSPRG